VNDKKSETRERFLAGWRARMNHHEVEDKQREIREHYLGTGVALGSGLGLAIGAGLGVAFGNLAWGVGVGLSIGTGIGIALGAARGNKSAKAVQEPSNTGDSSSA
jgi:F0F1-type ATP synthase assembly protein I